MSDGTEVPDTPESIILPRAERCPECMDRLDRPMDRWVCKRHGYIPDERVLHWPE